MDGWLKLHRSITDSSVFDDADVLKMWIWLLCNVAYNEHDIVYYGKIYQIKSGQIITGRKKISQQIKMSESKVYRALNILKLLGNINIKSNNKFSIITIVNWAKYQSETAKINIEITANQQQNEQQNNSKTDSKLNSKTTAQQQHSNTTKEYIEYKERKEEKKNNVALSGISPVGVSKDGMDIFVHENSGVQYVIKNGDMFDLSGKPLNNAGYPIIDFGLSKHKL